MQFILLILYNSLVEAEFRFWGYAGTVAGATMLLMAAILIAAPRVIQNLFGR